jgi:hypothetical protein
MLYFKFTKRALILINNQLAYCMWDDEEGHKNIHLANWTSIWMNKGFGGLGIPNLQGSWIRTHIQGDGACGGKLWMMNTILID